MRQLAPNLFDKRFDDLVEAGRSRLPSLAPEWTDYNAHDPGITLMDLLAWVAEAQIYSLARTRRDERVAYAALMGLSANGYRPARGLIWPDSNDPNSPAAMLSQPIVIERDAAVHTLRSETPTFRPAHRILLIPARIRSLITQLADGSVINQAGANRRSESEFQPFGDVAGPGDVLSMELESRGDAPLLPADRPDDARLVIGIRAAPAPGDCSDANLAAARRSSLRITLSGGAERFPLQVIEDTSEGFMRTGVCVLDVSGIAVASTTITIEFNAPRGFDRPPRVLCIEPNVIPISQGHSVDRELHGDILSLPDQRLDLNTPGLAFEPGTNPVKVEVADATGFKEWTRCDRLSDFGPADTVYELDPAAASVTFGNGINGKMPGAGAQVFVSYAVNDGTGGNTARNRKWLVGGISGTFGTNLDPVTGGEDPSAGPEQRRAARRALLEGHALVSSADIEAAALALPSLEVARAWVIPPQPRESETGTITLIAMQARADGVESGSIPETPRWLEAIRRQLSPRMPLGSRLAVAGPRYVEFTIEVRAEPEQGRDPVAVKSAIESELRQRLALVSDRPAMPQRAFGLAVTHRDLTAWLQALAEVRRVSSLQILVGGRSVDEVTVSRRGLPRIDLSASTIEVVRATTGGRR
jgi:predicted phage baseplate assembly protein